MSSNRLFHLYPYKFIKIYLSAKIKEDFGEVTFSLWTFKFWNLEILKTKISGVGSSITQSPNEVCEDCVVSKQLHELFSIDKSWRVKKVLNLMHSDIYSPLSHTSNDNKHYFIRFIDDYSQNTWVCFLKEKFKTFKTFKKFKVLAEKKVCCQIKYYRLIGWRIQNTKICRILWKV